MNLGIGSLTLLVYSVFNSNLISSLSLNTACHRVGINTSLPIVDKLKENMYCLIISCSEPLGELEDGEAAFKHVAVGVR